LVACAGILRHADKHISFSDQYLTPPFYHCQTNSTERNYKVRTFICVGFNPLSAASVATAFKIKCVVYCMLLSQRVRITLSLWKSPPQCQRAIKWRKTELVSFLPELLHYSVLVVVNVCLRNWDRSRESAVRNWQLSGWAVAPCSRFQVNAPLGARPTHSNYLPLECYVSHISKLYLLTQD
jgi:hypothetical protein